MTLSVTTLTELVIRLETLGHEPRAIYDALSKYIDRDVAIEIVHDITQWKKHKHSLETRQKMSAALKGRIVSPETRQKISASNKGRIVSPETRQKISTTKHGRKTGPRPLETRQKISAALKGKRKSLETRQKISMALTGKKRGSYKKRARFHLKPFSGPISIEQRLEMAPKKLLFTNRQNGGYLWLPSKR